jgi:hypothetical protein
MTARPGPSRRPAGPGAWRHSPSARPARAVGGTPTSRPGAGFAGSLFMMLAALGLALLTILLWPITTL